MKTEIKARAKINLFLHVTEKYENGLHGLESLVGFADEVFDSILIEPAENEGIEICGGEFASFINSGDNIISKVLRVFDLPSCRYSLTKNIPVGAGLGGGSSDAAAVTRYFDNYASVDRLSAIGSDVPVCYHNKACFFEGVGDVITEVRNFPRLYAVLINPRKELLTKDVFQRNVSSSVSGAVKNLDFQNDADMLIEFLRDQNNDLTSAAISIMPEIRQMLSLLDMQDGCLLSRMSGSGATCFGLFSGNEKAVLAAFNIKKHAPDVWVKSSSLS